MSDVTQLLARKRFGREGNGRGCLVSGWSAPEKRHTWAVGRKSILRLTHEPAIGDLMLELCVMPFIADGRLMSQRIFVAVNGQQVGCESLGGASWIGFRLPRAAFAQTGQLEVHFDCPDATPPSSVGIGEDPRQLAFALREAVIRDVPPARRFERRRREKLPIRMYTGSEQHRDLIRGMTGLAVSDLALAFESLGTGCEFGLFQRRCGVEPLGLLRFAGLPYSDLVSGLECGFAGIEDDDKLTCHIAGSAPEWMVQTTLHRLRYHTFRSPADVSAEQLLREQSRVLKFRREKLLEILATGEKFCVVRHRLDLTVSQALPLLGSGSV
jgi:hypothetical protein